MIRAGLGAVLAVLVMGSVPAARAQVAPGRLRWQVGQVLLYKVEHSTVASDTVGDTKSETKSLLKLTRRWQVLAVDPSGVATLQMSLVALLQERTTVGGEVLRYDSANPDKSTPQLKEFFTRLLNVPLATLQVDGQGRVVRVLESKFGPASSFENELPFIGVLPADGPRPGQTWERPYAITLSPPLGTGEKYDAVQRYACKASAGGLATVTLSTELKAPPKVAADGIPLWQMLPQGEVTFDLKDGRLQAAALKIDKELKGHQGAGSVCRFQSTYTIQYAGDK
jgi:hypothetical protein